MSRFRKDRGFERWLEMELVKFVYEEKKHPVSYNQWESSLAILRPLGIWGAGVWWAEGRQFVASSVTSLHPTEEPGHSVIMNQSQK